MTAVAPLVNSLIATDGPQLGDDYYSHGLRARFYIDQLKVPTLSKQHEQEAYAKIGYDVDEEAFNRRSERSLASGNIPRSVPPTQLEGPLVWGPADFADDTKFVYHLTDLDKAEIRGALEFFKEQGQNGNQVSRETFPLPGLEKRLAAICADVYEGHGFAIIRGLDPDAYVVEDLTIVYLGISGYIGERRGKQDQRGSMLMHVIRRNDERDGQYSEDKALAAEGGCSVLASAWTVYNELAATRPDLIHVLAEPNWPFDTFGRSPPFYKRALLYYYKDKLITSFSRRLLVGHEPFDARTAGIPGLTEQQAEALDALYFVARRHEIKPRMEKGDLRFINNMGVLHRREAFKNNTGTARHLVRIWLNNELMCWKLPRDLRVAWARVFEDEERKEYWDIEPPRKDGKILRVAGTCD